MKNKIAILIISIIAVSIIAFVFLENKDTSTNDTSIQNPDTNIENSQEENNEEEQEDNTNENQLINGKTLNERLKDAYNNLHAKGSAQEIRDNFLDLEIIYTDNGEDSDFGPNIYPFHYQYSAEADKTFSLCNIERTVFICDGKLNRQITDEDMDSGYCVVTPIYRN